MLLLIAPDVLSGWDLAVRHGLRFSGQGWRLVTESGQLRGLSGLPCLLDEGGALPKAHRFYPDWRLLERTAAMMLASGRLRLATDADIAAASVPVHARKI